jgi:ABC-type nitrate/sulfonate/bicarbonate transport system ATPase subunit
VEEAVYLAERVIIMTACPGSIKQVVNVGLAYPRHIADHGFITLREKITSSIVEEVKII